MSPHVYKYYNLFTGLLIGSFVKKFGSKSVSLFGSLMTTIGFFLSSFLFSVQYLYIVYGIIGGRYISCMTTYISSKSPYRTQRLGIVDVPELHIL